VFNRLPVRYSIRPVPVAIDAPIFSEKYNTRVCLIVKDPREAFKDLNLTFPFDLKVFDLEKLKLKFSRFKERRALLKEFDLFLCDAKVYKILKRYLGKPFYDAKKYPVPVVLEYSKPDEIKETIIKNVSKINPIYMAHGPNYSVKVGRAVMTNEELTKNIVDVSASVAAHIIKWGVDFTE
jgi:ribosome biogenesis protein UTP30